MKSSSPSPVSAEIMKMRSKVDRLAGGVGERQQALALHRVDLVEEQHLRMVDVAEPGKQRLRLLVDALAGVDQQRHDIGVARPAPGGIDHGPVEPALRLEDAGRVDKDDLRAAGRGPDHGNAAHHRARRLHLVADDGNLGADQPVDQGRLAGVGRADERHEAAARRRRARPAAHRVAGHTPSRNRTAVAAACSASRRLRPSPRPGSSAPMRTVMTKVGAWSGPLRSAIS